MYIRTKDGVYVLSEAYWAGNKDEILAEADTIEELCDLYIDEETHAIFHKHNGYVINWKTNMVYSLKALSESYHSVKGAIYTDKGLIYVAKMNENGELELI